MQASSVKIAWKIMLALGIYTAVLGLLWIFPTETAVVAPAFNSFTAQSWSDFLAANPKPAELFIITERALGAMVLSAGLFIALIAWKSYRKLEKWSWYTLLIISILGWGTWLAYHISTGDLRGLVAVYIGIVLFVIAIALPAKAILSKQPVAAQPRTLEAPSAQREQEWWESKWTPIIVVIILGAVVFGIAQPFIWRGVYQQNPPSVATQLSALLTIILSLVAVGIAAFSILGYLDLRHRLRESLGREITNKSNILLARARGAVAYGFWRTWLLGRHLGRLDHELIDSAIKGQKKALGLVEQLSKEEYEKLSNEVKESINQQKSNLTAYIVHNLRFHLNKIDKEKRPEQLSIARKYGKEAYDQATKFGEKYDWKANYAALLINFGTRDEKKLARKIISQLKQKQAQGEITNQEMEDYYDLFGLEPRAPTRGT